MSENKKAPFSVQGESRQLGLESNNKDNNKIAVEEKNELPYLRIGCIYYRKSDVPLPSGRSVIKLIPWSRQTIKDDHSAKDILQKIPKYIGRATIPNNIDYLESINGYYNNYEALSYRPSANGSYETILRFISHIFNEDYEMGLDYIQLLYLKPLQMLPVLCLVSKKRNTGKTTFLEFLQDIFGANVTINTIDDFRSQFNSDFSAKLIIGIEEVLFDKLEDTEKIKFLSTTRSFKSQKKGLDREEVFFFGKFILLSNHPETFIKISPEEERFWIRNVRAYDVEDVHLKQKMREEIPCFLNFLLSRKIVNSKVSRMWFNPKDLQNEAFKRVVNRNVSNVERELISIFKTLIETYEVEELCFSISDLQNLLLNSSRTNISEIRTIVKKSWLKTSKPNSFPYSNYSRLNNGTFKVMSSKGRFYTFSKEWIYQYSDDLMID